MTEHITQSEFLSELERLGLLDKGDDTSYTSLEIAAQVQRSQQWVRNKLKILQKEGRLVATQKLQTSLSGENRYVASYIILSRKTP